MLWRDTRALVREIRGDVAVSEHKFSGGQIILEQFFVFEAIAGVEQRGKMGIHVCECTEFAVQIPGGHTAEKALVARKSDGGVRDTAGLHGASEHIELCAFAGAVDSFEHNQFAASRHRERQSSISSCEFGSLRGANEWRKILRDKMQHMARAATSIAENIERVRERIARAAERSGRNPEQIVLVAATKTVSETAIRAAYDAGVRAFGENRVQEWESKQLELADLKASWHLIGHLQSNKARRAARLFDWIDSVDDVPLAIKLDEAAGETNEWLAVLIEVQLDPRETKSGVAQVDLPAAADAILQMPHLQLRGLMAVPPQSEDPRDARPYFRRLRRLRDDLEQQFGRSFPELSMGMSHDFEVAIEEGATQVRVGSAIFGERARK